MKNYILLILLFLSFQAFSQEKGIGYQAVILFTQELPGADNRAAPLGDQDVCLKFLFKDAIGNNEYEEIIFTRTDSYGMINLVIGTGERIGGSSRSFGEIEWSAAPKFLDVSLDKEGLCANFKSFSSQEFTAVPFALFAANSGNLNTGIQGETGLTGADGEMGSQGLAGETGIQGETGLTGSVGTKGDTGDIGSTGLQGTVGDAGIQGIQGETGLTGLVGTKGDTGDIGLTGLQGTVGDAGIQGIQGETGLTGLVGTKGDTGEIGSTGLQGTDGDVGIQGIQGEKGLTGLVGTKGDTGEIGLTGLQGTVGDAGIQGIQGETGLTGLVGTKGDTGDIGSTGLQGTVGDAGIQGIQGETGLTGLVGTKGDTGDIGSTGLQGTVGDAGIQGIKGEKGLTGLVGTKGDTGEIGSTGLQGTVGDAGIQGIQGETGLTGLVGTKGDTGDIGSTGLQGTVGDAGIQGIQGEKGLTGSVGTKGDTGEIGSTGLQGTDGDVGIQGIQGEKGLTGLVGTKGDTGDIGSTGLQGTVGDAGIQGIQGETGLTGLVGTKGDTGEIGLTGLQGTVGDSGIQGIQGETGLKGTDGVSASSDSFVDLSTDQTVEGNKTFAEKITADISGNAATVITNADLTGAVTSIGNATSIADGAVTNLKLDKINIPLSGFAAAESDISFGTNKITDLAEPVSAQDAATKNYVDNASLINSVSEENVVSNTSTESFLLSGMTLSPPVGTYLALFNGQMSSEYSFTTSQGNLDVVSIYIDLMSATGGVAHSLVFGSEILLPGVYDVTGATSLAGTLTLDGQDDPNSVFIIRSSGAITTGVNTIVLLTNQANARNVFWVSEGAISTADPTIMKGTLIANQAAVSLGANTNLEGRMFAVTGALTMGASSTLAIPSGVAEIDLGVLSSFAMYTADGAVSDCATCQVTGDVGTGLGAISGFANIIGTINPAGSIASNSLTTSYSVYQNGVEIPNSVRTIKALDGIVSLQTMITITEEDTPVEIRWKVDSGESKIGHRNLVLIRSGN